jgi:hypothetical protein
MLESVKAPPAAAARTAAASVTDRLSVRDVPYPLAVAPAVLGILAGVALTTAYPGTHPHSIAYAQLPEYHLWRTAMVAQLGIYLTVAAWLWLSGRDPERYRGTGLQALPAGDALWTALAVLIVVLMPNVAVRGEAPLPFHAQNLRMAVVILAGTVAILGVMLRVAQVHAAFRTVQDAASHARLRQLARDLLAMAAVIVTLATLGSGVLQTSLHALAAAAPTYQTNMTTAHVAAYGGYYSLLLVLFFTPVLVAERQAAVRIAEHATAHADEAAPEFAARLGLQSSMMEHIGSAFGVLSPLLGALATRLL